MRFLPTRMMYLSSMVRISSGNSLTGSRKANVTSPRKSVRKLSGSDFVTFLPLPLFGYNPLDLSRLYLEPTMGFEPMTCRLRIGTCPSRSLSFFVI